MAALTSPVSAATTFLHRRVAVRAAEDVLQARAELKRLARAVGLAGEVLHRAELIVTELGTNLVHHAERGGEILLRVDAATSEVLCVDEGPGIDPRAASGRVSPRAGLHSIGAMAEMSEVHSDSGGTVVLARLGASDREQSAFDVGAVAVAHPHEEESGDAFALRRTPAGLRVLVVDGLGHGAKAADAARRLVASFERHDTLEALLEHVHGDLAGTRGAVFAVAEIEPERKRLRFTGIGNVSGRVYADAATPKGLASRPGIAGGGGSRSTAVIDEQAWTPGSRLVLATDGLKSGWKPGELSSFWRLDPTTICGALYRSFRRTNDDVTVVTVKDRTADTSSR